MDDSNRTGPYESTARDEVVTDRLYGLWHQRRREELASHLVEQLLVADVTRVADVAGQLDDLPGPWRSRLDRIAADDSSPRSERLRAHLAAVRDDPRRVAYLVQRLVEAPPVEFGAILQALQPQKAPCCETLWSLATDPTVAVDRRFRAAALADLDPENGQWACLATWRSGGHPSITRICTPTGMSACNRATGRGWGCNCWNVRPPDCPW
jgi:hypothetical protein